MDETATLVNFRCKRCGEALCETDGACIRVMVQGYVAYVYVERFVFECTGCGREQTWRRTARDHGRRPAEERKH